MQQAAAYQDPYLRFTADIKPRCGLSVVDEASITPGPSLTRTREEGGKDSYCTYPRSPKELLCRGAAAAIGPDGLVSHVSPTAKGQKFIGFVEGNLDGDKVNIWGRGRITLNVQDATHGDRGRAVYAESANKFTLQKSGSSVEIGVIRYVQGGRAAISFKRHDDLEPHDLNVDQC